MRRYPSGRATIAVCLALTLLALVGCGSKPPAQQSTSQPAASQPAASQPAASQPAAQSQAPAAAAKTYKWKLGHVAPAQNHPWVPTVDLFIKKVKEYTGGRITIDVFPAGQLGQEKEVLTAVRSGSVEMTHITAVHMSTVTPAFNGWQLPFLVDNYAAVRAMTVSPLTQEALDGLESLGVKGLSLTQTGFRNLFTKQPVNGPADLKGKKLRITPGPVMVDVFNSWGASPTPVPIGDVYSALQTGVIDGMDIDLPISVALKFTDHAKNLFAANHFAFPAMFIINLDLWKSLSKDDQAAIVKAAKEAQDFNLKDTERWDTEALAKIKASGTQVVVPTNKQVWLDSVKSVYDKHGADPMVQKFIAEAKKLQSK